MPVLLHMHLHLRLWRQWVCLWRRLRQRRLRRGGARAPASLRAALCALRLVLFLPALAWLSGGSVGVGGVGGGGCSGLLLSEAQALALLLGVCKA